MSSSDISALLGSRICHDLISPLGAIGNGIELLQMSGMGDSPEMSLITESVENANARIRLFRVAFGAAQPDQTVARREVETILSTFGSARSLEIDWQLEEALPRDMTRLIFLLLLCGESALPWGGKIAVALAGDDLRVELIADRVRNEAELWRHLATTDALLPDASEIHFYLARQAAEAMGRTVDVELGEKRVVLTA
ncbi:histidine phosphotransferase ChpT [Palleronia aestuarii]|uniref:Histidine phosphotransferase ChpT n=1 Tax=Palleronia aestuarii TaxID=568105 RepID=A0A2W7P946_9RHOB|nr:histidine phosphotransferase family protein [Palleronia aestuarii]PZX19882.1 histidine phosphotransferase ChpT [Palleronia aestuarii]